MITSSKQKHPISKDLPKTFDLEADPSCQALCHLPRPPLSTVDQNLWLNGYFCMVWKGHEAYFHWRLVGNEEWDDDHVIDSFYRIL